MSDDLITRLRAFDRNNWPTMHEAALEIERLREELTTSTQSEDAERRLASMWHQRAEAAERNIELARAELVELRKQRNAAEDVINQLRVPLNAGAVIYATDLNRPVLQWRPDGTMSGGLTFDGNARAEILAAIEPLPWREGDDCKRRCEYCGAIDDGNEKHKEECEWGKARATLDAAKEAKPQNETEGWINVIRKQGEERRTAKGAKL